MCALSSPVWPEKRNAFSSLCQKAAMGEVPFQTGLYSVNTRLASVHQQNVVDLSRKPKMIKHLPHRASEFGIEPIQQRRLGWDNEIVVSFSG